MYGKRPYLVRGHFSNIIKSGPLLDAVKVMLPNITELCLNKNVECPPHVDKGNYGDSWILFLCDFEGGGACLF